MATIKQIKIGSTNYDIKALNATNQNQASAVVRDIQYGTNAPSGGSAGQMYLQYDSSTTNNPYIYAEDTIGNSQNAVDNYYSKSEVDNLLTPHFFQYNVSLPASVNSGNRVNVNFTVHGNGYILMFASLMDNSNGNYGTMRVGFDYKHGSDAWFALSETLDRNISQGSGQYSARVSSSTTTTVENGDKLRVFYSVSNDATTHILRCQFLSFGCYVTQD